jgi:hypothetical protein
MGKELDAALQDPRWGRLVNRYWQWARLLLVGVAWWASPGTAAPGQLATAGVGIGEHVTLSIDRENAPVQCEAIDVRDQFLGCAADKRGGGTARESWYNLRFVTRIDKSVKD